MLGLAALDPGTTVASTGYLANKLPTRNGSEVRKTGKAEQMDERMHDQVRMHPWLVCMASPSSPLNMVLISCRRFAREYREFSRHYNQLHIRHITIQ